jgi:hypothetical protein
MIRSFLNFDL